MNNQLEFIPELMPLNMGPPLPRSMGIYWPWYKPPEVPVAEAPPAVVYPPVTYPPVAPPVVAYPPVAPPVAPPVIAYPPVAVPEAPPPAALYVCPVCGAQFADLSDLYVHMEEVHPEAPPEVPLEVFTCPTCGLQFSTFGELQAHIAEAHPPEFSISTMSYPPGGGTITTDKPTYRLGERVTLTARPSPGYEFSHWEGIPGLPTDLTYRFPIDRDMIVTGVFKLLEELPPEVPIPPPVPRASISIAAPASAKAGEKVVVDVETTNLMEDRYHLGTELSVNAIPILRTSEFIPGRASRTYGMSFYMPRVPASLVAVVSYRSAAGPWVPIGSASKVVGSVEVPEVPRVPEVPEVPEVPIPPPPEAPEVLGPPTTGEEWEAFGELAVKVNRELGGSYVAGILTPPADWVGSVTEWSRHVQEETLKRWLLGERP